VTDQPKVYADPNRVSYEEGEQIVLDFQSGLAGSSERLIDAYEGYLVNFLQLLNQGELNTKYVPMVRFLTLFVKDRETRKRILRWKYSASGRTELLAVKAMVRNQFKNFSRDEIWSELVIILLNLATRYRKRDDKSGFHNYMYRAYHFWVYREIMKLISDPLVWNQDKLAGINELGSLDQEVTFDEAGFIEREGHMAVDLALDEINENWVGGLTCSDRFAELSTFERRVLQMYYVDDMEDAEIAAHLGCCRATVNRRRLKAKEKLHDAK
jgi:RNA polymerase sigma factor (sigma-70 family)